MQSFCSVSSSSARPHKSVPPRSDGKSTAGSFEWIILTSKIPRRNCEKSLWNWRNFVNGAQWSFWWQRSSNMMSFSPCLAIQLSCSPTICYTLRFNNNKQLTTTHLVSPTSTKARDIQNDDALQGWRDIDLRMVLRAPSHTLLSRTSMQTKWIMYDIVWHKIIGS